MNETRLRELIAEAAASAAIRARTIASATPTRRGRLGKIKSTALCDASRSASRLRERRG